MGKREQHSYFDKDFKYEAIRLMNKDNRSVKDIAGDLGISSESASSVEAPVLGRSGSVFPRKRSSTGA